MNSFPTKCTFLGADFSTYPFHPWLWTSGYKPCSKTSTSCQVSEIVCCLMLISDPHESERESESHSVASDSLRPHGLYSPWNSPGQNTTGVGSCPSPGDLPNPGIKPRSLHTSSFSWNLPLWCWGSGEVFPTVKSSW